VVLLAQRSTTAVDTPTAKHSALCFNEIEGIVARDRAQFSRQQAPHVLNASPHGGQFGDPRFTQLRVREDAAAMAAPWSGGIE